MLALELHTRDIGQHYRRFSEEIGSRHWTQRVALLKAEIRGNVHLRALHEQENEIAYQLDQLETTRKQFGSYWPAYDKSDFHLAAALMAQVLSVVDAVPPVVAEQFRRRVRGALKNPDDMRGLRLELTSATHFLFRRLHVTWPEMVAGTVAKGKIYDFCVEDLTPSGLEVECKSFSSDKGRRVTRRHAIDLIGLLWSRHGKALRAMQTHIAATLTLQLGLPTQYRERVELVDTLAHHILNGVSGDHVLVGASVKIAPFDPAEIEGLDRQAAPNADHRRVLDRLTGTANKEVALMGLPAGGALAVAVQSAQDDSLWESMLETVKAARDQFSGSRAGLIVVGLDGLTADQLLDVAMDEQRADTDASMLQLLASEVLGSSTRKHIAGIVFISASAISPDIAGTQRSGGAAYYFLNRGSAHWDESLAGLFGENPRSIGRSETE